MCIRACGRACTCVSTCTRNSHRHARASSLCLCRAKRRRGKSRGIKQDGTRFCARVQRLRVGREGGTSITRYIGRVGGRGRRREGRPRWKRPERGAGKSSRAANCPPSYPPYTLSHTLARNHPYPPLPPPRSPPTRPSHPTRYPLSSSSPAVSRGRLAHLSSSSSSRLPTTLSPRPSALSLGGSPRRATASKALDYLPPYKRSCCPFITTTPATTTTERPTPVTTPRFLSSSAFHRSSLPPTHRFPPAALTPYSTTTFDARRPRNITVSFLRAVRAGAPPRSLLTL